MKYRKTLAALAAMTIAASSAIATTIPASANSAQAAVKKEYVAQCGAKNSVVFLGVRGSTEIGYTDNAIITQGSKTPRKSFNPTTYSHMVSSTKDKKGKAKTKTELAKDRSSKYYGFGTRLPGMVSKIESEFIKKAKTKKVSAPKFSYLSVGYPAHIFSISQQTNLKLLEQFQLSAGQGTSSLTNVLMNLTSYCPNAQVVVLGYSQGAQVIHRTLEQIAPKKSFSKTPKIVSSVHLVADPLRNTRDQNVIHVATQDTSKFKNTIYRSGIFGGSGVNIPSSFKGKTYSYCSRGDFFCDSSLALKLRKTTQSLAVQGSDAQKIAYLVKKTKAEMAVHTQSYNTGGQRSVIAKYAVNRYTPKAK